MTTAKGCGMDIKTKIKDLMEAKHLSSYSLAQAAGLSQPCISNWYGKRNYEPSISALEKVCEVLEISMAELFCSDKDTLVPISQEFLIVYENWQKLNSTQKAAIISHIESYLG